MSRAPITAAAPAAAAPEFPSDAYLRCERCGWSYTLEHTPDDEPCGECGGRLVVSTVDRPPNFVELAERPRPRQAIAGGTAALVPGYAPHRVEERHEALSLFDPAPAPLEGALELPL